MNDLCRTAVHETKRRPQDLMAVDQIDQALLVDLNIERPNDANSLAHR